MEDGAPCREAAERPSAKGPHMQRSISAFVGQAAPRSNGAPCGMAAEWLGAELQRIQLGYQLELPAEMWR